MSDSTEKKYPKVVAEPVVDLLGVISDLTACNVAIAQMLIQIYGGNKIEKKTLDDLNENLRSCVESIRDMTRRVPREGDK